MKKAFACSVLATMLTTSVLACDYQTSTGTYQVVNNYYNNYGGTMNVYSNNGSGYQEVNSVEYVADTCGYCGLTWDVCTCYDGNYQEECYGNDSGCAVDYSTGCSDNWSDNNVCAMDNYCYQGYSGTMMAHWGNLRDACGNIIGQVDAGSCVEVIGQCEDNPSRTLIYDYATGCYGTVASVYLYGGTCYEYENPTEWGGCGYTAQYDETTTWACDAYPGETTECSYDYTNYSDCYIDVDLSSDTISVVNNGVIIITGTCTVNNRYEGQEFCFDDQKCSGIWWQCSDGFYDQACQYMSNDSKVCCH